MPRKPNPPPDDPEESARFVETAKALEADKGKAAFGRAFKKVIPKGPTGVRRSRPSGKPPSS